MKTVFIECNMGASGDMLTGALFDLITDKEQFLSKINALGIPNCTVSCAKSQKCGITGTKFSVKINGVEETNEPSNHPNEPEQVHTHSHGHGLRDIEHIIDHMPVSEKVKKDAESVYHLIADAESQVHGVPVEQVHFHEVGTMDAVADITTFCLLMEEIAPERVLASPVHVGSGEVHCAHGILPVPAPATALLLRGIPIYGGQIKGELCTPTGAALLKYFVSSFGSLPQMVVSKIGYGIGGKDFETSNSLRVLLGETKDAQDEVIELNCSLDDMTPEAIGFVQERLFEGGALDVTTTAIGMKKNRPGVLLSVTCRRDYRDQILRLIFKHTSTLGVRESITNRYVLSRSTHTIQTEYGSIRVKEASGWGTTREKFEYEDLAKIANKSGLSLQELIHKIGV